MHKSQIFTVVYVDYLIFKVSWFLFKCKHDVCDTKHFQFLVQKKKKGQIFLMHNLTFSPYALIHSNLQFI